MNYYHKGHGFSLVEIMVSIALFMLLAGLIVSNAQFLNRFLLRAEVDKIFNTFVYLQRCAISTGQKQTLLFDLEKHEYCYNKKICKLSRQVRFGIVKDSKGPPCSPGKAVQSPITFKSNKVVFKNNGIISSGTIYIVDTYKKYMYAISSSVAQASYVRKYVYDGKWILIT